MSAKSSPFSCLSRLSCISAQSVKSPPASKDTTRTAKTEMCRSVFLSARETELFDERELKSLEELENAAVAALRESSLQESVFFDAVEDLDESSIMYPPAAIPNPHPHSTIDIDNPSSLLHDSHVPPGDTSVGKGQLPPLVRAASGSIRRILKSPRVKVELRGYPGDLTEDELSACLRFRSELNKRKEDGNAAYREMVDSFHKVEKEEYALCRFLRSRNFDVDLVFKMMDEGVETWNEGKRNDFYPDPDKAIGAPLSVLLTQYPTLYFGNTKTGCPVLYFQAGKVTVDGVECVTELDKLTNFAWYNTMGLFCDQVAKAQAENPDVVRCEGVSVIDLEGLDASNLNSRTLEVLKKMIKINVCFPETLNSMVILNAPSFFSFSWMIIKKFVDPRTAAKVTILSNKKKGEQWLKERIEMQHILSDYGGNACSFSSLMQMQGQGTVARRRLVELLSIPKLSERKFKFELASDEKVDFQVYTRSLSGAEFSLFRDDSILNLDEVKRSKGSDANSSGPYCVDIGSTTSGPGKFRVVLKAKCKTGTDHFLVIGRVT